MLLTVILLLSSVPTTAFAATIEKREYPYGDTMWTRKEPAAL